MKEAWLCLARLSGALAGRDQVGVRRELELAATLCEPDEVEEILLQSYLFLGYPAALSGLGAWREVSGRDASLSYDEPAIDPGARGEALCRKVYGANYDALRRNIAALHPSIDRWMVVEGYGRVLGRPAAKPDLREACVVGLLAVLDAQAQLHSHLRGALAVGVSIEDVEEVLRAVEAFMSESAVERGRATWEKVKERCSSIE
jgi:4-carboxymuconolactone decarboxylase